MEPKFKPRDIVEHVVSAGQTPDSPKTTYIKYGQDARSRYFVLEILTLQCYAGTQIKYHCRGVLPDGRTGSELVSFFEPELVLSRPFCEDPIEGTKGD